MANPRIIARLEARILERAAYAVGFEVSDPRLALVTLIRCELARDLSNAKLFYSVIGSPADRRNTQRALDSAAGFIQRQVGRVLRTRRTPRLQFEYDDSVRLASEMDLRIREAMDKDRTINPEAHGDAKSPPPAAPDSVQDVDDLDADDDFEEEVPDLYGRS